MGAFPIREPQEAIDWGDLDCDAAPATAVPPEGIAFLLALGAQRCSGSLCSLVIYTQRSRKLEPLVYCY